MKKTTITFTIIILSLFLVACNNQDTTTNDTIETTEETADTIAPIFMGLIDDELGAIEHKKGQDVNLLEGVTAIDNISTVTVSIKDLDGYDKDTPGLYIVIYEAIDLAGNHTTVNRKVYVLSTSTITFDALVVNENASEYVYNSTTALAYTSSGTSFRTSDAIHVMTKEFFKEEYNAHKNEHGSNGNIPYLPHGVVLVVDQDMHVKQLRVAVGSLVEVNSEGVVKTNSLSWTNSIDALNGGGNFKGLIDEIDTLIPDGGYVIFTANKDEATGRKFLIQNFFYKAYSGGNISSSSFNVDFQLTETALVDDYTEVIDVIDEHPIGAMVKEDLVYDGIPFTIYYKNDKKPKSILYFFHGFGGDRNGSIMGRGEALAEMGFLVVAMDAYLHGERKPEYFTNLSNANKQKEIVNIQIRTAQEAKQLFDKYFINWEHVNPDKAYAFGVSMGAGTGFYLTSIMSELQTFVSIVGSPSFYDFYQYKRDVYNWARDDYYNWNLDSYTNEDPLLNFERLQNKNIFMGNGNQDTTVPLIYAQELASKIDSINVIFKTYDTAHSSTPAMIDEAYQFLLNH